MTLAYYLSHGEHELICDFAETYRVFDWRALPVRLAATLAAGLREDSRIRMKVADARLDNDIWLLASIVDRLSILIWQNTKDGAHGVNKPKSLVEMMTNEDKGKPKENIAYASGEEFERAWKLTIERMRRHG